MDSSKIEIGYKLFIKKNMDGTSLHKGEVLGIKELNNKRYFYIHYVDYNKRLDEWISEDLLKLDDLSEIEVPKKKKKKEPIKKEPIKKRTSLMESDDEKHKTIKDDEIYKLKNVNKIKINEYLIEAWYFSPYPELLVQSDVIYICPFCLFYFRYESSLKTHLNQCKLRHPPGNEIYRKNDLSFFELDGHMQKNYCRNLSLLSKLFLDHKTLYYDIDVFMFYVLCRYTPTGYHILGYFSKEKNSEQGYNLACILTLPHEQKKGYGKVLIDFSYLLSKKEKRCASPEKPLSDLGLLSYRSYWTETIVELLRQVKSISIKEISLHTSITEEDIIHTLCAKDILKFYKGEPCFILNTHLIEKSILADSYRVDPNALKWDIHLSVIN
ncbi:hypothetical protein H312_02732 [Anncaliia algerae PRA339]|uniref:histone acetyltransferase n=1 Tax=Anncaliia algerae PRA339 TaxID=1288291 RepID=A0A059EYE2_9MICR|nr:hypothetical protein H312_02732 [Anncaliia algerae PRA339]